MLFSYSFIITLVVCCDGYSFMDIYCFIYYNFLVVWITPILQRWQKNAFCFVKRVLVIWDLFWWWWGIILDISLWKFGKNKCIFIVRWVLIFLIICKFLKEMIQHHSLILTNHDLMFGEIYGFRRVIVLLSILLLHSYYYKD